MKTSRYFYIPEESDLTPTMLNELPTVEINLIGALGLRHKGEIVSLPASRKTRALFAYLVMTRRPQRRSRLCEIFWELPNDPKGALRWSLSKIRCLLPDAERPLIEADRERVCMGQIPFVTDIERIQQSLRSRFVDGETLLDHFDMLGDDLLIREELLDLAEYTEWLRAARRDLEDLKVQVIARACGHEGIAVNKKIHLLEQWLALRPTAEEAIVQLHDQLNAQRRTGEATSLREAHRELFQPTDKKINSDRVDQVGEHRHNSRDLLASQAIKFCKTHDGVSLAYATIGKGPPLIKAANWLSHLEYDWSAPIWSPIFKELAQDFTFVRYDERGNGLSDWDVNEISQDVFVEDLGSIVEQTGFEKFPLLGISQGAAVCIDYAVANPDRVSALILFGGYPKGWRIDATPEVAEMGNAMMVLTRTGWGQENPAYRHLFSATFMPSATAEQLSWFDDFQRKTTHSENAVRFLEAFADIDVRDKLSQIKVPTLVIHSKGDQRVHWTVGRDMALEIPGAKFVLLESDNHLLLEGEPAAAAFLNEVRGFLLE